MNDVLVVIPTYNEIDNLGDVVARILRATGRADILVVDDNSPDGTGRLADELAAASDRVRVIHRTVKSGLGDAYRAGFGWGLAHGYALLVEMDGDGSHQPEQLPDLLSATDSADVVLGSRWTPGGSAPNWALRRILLSRAGSFYARFALGLTPLDATGGYRVYAASALRRIDYASVESQGYCFQIEMLWRASEARLRVVEVPIEFAERASGVSKMSSSIVLEAIARVTEWGVANLPRRIRRALHPGSGSVTSDGSLSSEPLRGRPVVAHRLDGSN
jgi:dolichol-phosphate mannosyltransferase